MVCEVREGGTQQLAAVVGRERGHLSWERGEERTDVAHWGQNCAH